jgi:hypothetical protein
MRSSAIDGRSRDSGRGSRMCSTRSHSQRKSFRDLRTGRRTSGSPLSAASGIGDSGYEPIFLVGVAFLLGLFRAAVSRTLETAQNQSADTTIEGRLRVSNNYRGITLSERRQSTCAAKLEPNTRLLKLALKRSNVVPTNDRYDETFALLPWLLQSHASMRTVASAFLTSFRPIRRHGAAD